MDLIVSKTAKDFLKRKFEKWYSKQVMLQLEGQSLDNLESADIQLVQLGMPMIKEVSAQWLVKMAEYISNNPQLIVSGVVCSGISWPIDDVEDSANEDYSDVDTVESADYSDFCSEKSDIDYIVHWCSHFIVDRYTYEMWFILSRLIIS